MVAFSIRFAARVLLKSWVFIWMGLLHGCYGKVGCLFDQGCCLCVMGKTVADLIGVSACMLKENRLLI